MNTEKFGHKTSAPAMETHCQWKDAYKHNIAHNVLLPNTVRWLYTAWTIVNFPFSILVEGKNATNT